MGYTMAIGTKVVGLALLALTVAACRDKGKTYDVNVEVTRVTAVRKDELGKPITTDLELSYVDCPGTQVEVIRGGKEFSECVQKLAVGAKIPVKLEHKWDPEGYYDYEVFEVAGCPRPPDPNDEASYKMVRDCEDWNVNGATVGFQCKYADKKVLNQACPWFRTR